MSERRPPISEIQMKFARSAGPGGQHVNKTNSAVQLRWNVPQSVSFTEEEKVLLIKKLANRITQEGYLLVESSSQRDRNQNIRIALDKLGRLVENALLVPKSRKPSQPPVSAKRNRSQAKKAKSEKKKLRQKVDY